MRIEHKLGEVGRGSGVAVGHVDAPTVGGGDEAVVDPEFQAKARLVRKSETDCRGPIWRVVLWPWASTQRSVTLVWSVEGSTRGSLGRTERMEVWVEKTALSKSMVVGCRSSRSSGRATHRHR
jgi:hypothetical protein